VYIDVIETLTTVKIIVFNYFITWLKCVHRCM
jgi:hypothetical protein